MNKLENFYILIIFFHTVPDILTITEVAIFHNKILFEHILERHTGCIGDVIQCGKLCSNHLTCMSFFYKADGIPICQLHSTVFTDVDAAKDVQGWLYYVFDYEWCPYHDEDGFLLNRLTGICIRYMNQGRSYQQMKSNCERLNATLLQLTSSGKEREAVNIISQIWPLHHYFIIQGTFNQSWQLDDGTNMTYFNWNPGKNTMPQPTFKILVEISSGNNGKPTSGWFLVDGISSQMDYVCEKI